MKLAKPANINYCATVIKIDKLIPIKVAPNKEADSIVNAIIFGNSVVVSKNTKIGDVGVFFPLECKLSPNYLKYNNLYRDKTLNADKEKGGFFEENGRIRAVKMIKSTVKSEGLYAGLESLEFTVNPGDLSVGDEFDTLNGNIICEKYVVRVPNTSGPRNQKKTYKKAGESKLIPNIWHYHIDTPQLKKELFKLSPDDFVDFSWKIHGSSFISGKVLCKKPLNTLETILKFLGVNIVSTQYDYMWSSRKVLKGDLIRPAKGFYDVDIWGLVHEQVKEFLEEGMTIYGEVYGQLPGGGWIQKLYDYGAPEGTWDYMIYRITTTDTSGKVFEWSMKQVRDFCAFKGIKCVPQLYYGTLGDYLSKKGISWDDRNFHDVLLETLCTEYLEKDSVLCKNTVPEEGIVVRREAMDIEVWKLKAFRFFEMETKSLDNSEVDIESEQSS